MKKEIALLALACRRAVEFGKYTCNLVMELHHISQVSTGQVFGFIPFRQQLFTTARSSYVSHQGGSLATVMLPD